MKTNIGHLEAAAGVAGADQGRAVPAARRDPGAAALHASSTRTSRSTARACSSRPDPTRGRPAPARRLAGVSSFGFGGTNAHVVVEEAPRLPAAAGARRAARCSCCRPRPPTRCADRGPASAGPLARGDAPAPPTVGDVCATAAAPAHPPRRPAGRRRRRRAAELVERLRAVRRTAQRRPGIAVGRREPGGRRRVAFVFSGQGTQWWGMGRDLLRRRRCSGDVVEACDALLRGHVPWSLLDELPGPRTTSAARPAPSSPSRRSSPSRSALAALWRSWGITPDAVVGHSVGEVAAAHVAGALTLDDAVRVIAARGPARCRPRPAPARWRPSSCRCRRSPAAARRRSATGSPSPPSTPRTPRCISGEPAADGRRRRRTCRRPGPTCARCRSTTRSTAAQMAPHGRGPRRRARRACARRATHGALRLDGHRRGGRRPGARRRLLGAQRAPSRCASPTPSRSLADAGLRRVRRDRSRTPCSGGAIAETMPRHRAARHRWSSRSLRRGRPTGESLLDGARRSCTSPAWPSTGPAVCPGRRRSSTCRPTRGSASGTGSTSPPREPADRPPAARSTDPLRRPAACGRPAIDGAVVRVRAHASDAGVPRRPPHRRHRRRAGHRRTSSWPRRRSPRWPRGPVGRHRRDVEILEALALAPTATPTTVQVHLQR